jgi:Ca2+-binding EF-hand superfamily protein
VSQENQKKKKKQLSQVVATLKKQLEDEQQVSSDLRQQLKQQQKEMKQMQKTMESAAAAMNRVQSQEEMINSMRQQIQGLRIELAHSEEERKSMAAVADYQEAETEQPLVDQPSPVNPDAAHHENQTSKQFAEQEGNTVDISADEEQQEDELPAGLVGQEDPENILGRAAMLGVPDLSLNTLLTAMEQLVDEKQGLEGTCQVIAAQKEMTESRLIFMNMDCDRDGLITREEMLSCQELTLPPFVVDRAFGGWVCPLHSKVRSKMDMTDFLKFRDWVDDACTSDKSLTCWFRCLDVDGDGVITFDDLKVVFREVMDFVQKTQQQQMQMQQQAYAAMLAEADGATEEAGLDSAVSVVDADASDDAQRLQQQIQLVKGDEVWDKDQDQDQVQQKAGGGGDDDDTDITEENLESKTQSSNAGDEGGGAEAGGGEDEEEQDGSDAADLAAYESKVAEGPRLDVYLSRLSDMVKPKKVGRFTLTELKKAPLRGEFVQVALQPWWSKY